ncbi:hypothetical protein INT45_008741 [Circinella minor]|uniref:Uncharacterized protein n=1 Tax=Circinella minor TaxID=1195481 RepID=A0A8H7S1M4_9FUNG|nr:hypothetical protein INT45_008741 [Circinella minor]
MALNRNKSTQFPITVQMVLADLPSMQTRVPLYSSNLWRTHWLPSYPLKNYHCGFTTASKEHYDECHLLHQHLLDELTTSFGTVYPISGEVQPLDIIINNLLRSEVGLTLGKWPKVWPALIRVLRKIDCLIHPDNAFDEEEPDPDDTINLTSLPHTQSFANT